ncbi:MAG: hypothetical protein D6795_13950 [Deltaproteobacteria bacterium]|nr:MAG: hypothetical protein D6795_13950 [Deltaproteobacteria bacterium]
MILAYNDPPFDAIAVDLVFNGDTFDFLKTRLDGGYPLHITAERALGKFHAIAAAHPDFFTALRGFLCGGGGERRIFFIVGNHDAELLFPAVQAAIRERVGCEEGIEFPGFEFDIGEVHIEHGSQRDPMFRMAPEQLFLEEEGEPILALPWGSLALLEVAIPLQPQFYHLDRVKPRERLFEIMPEAKEFLLAKYWRYWTRDYLKALLSGTDPLKTITWRMLREIIYRFASADPEVKMGKYFERAVRETERFRLYLAGHRHEAAWMSYGNRKFLQTGCLRNEFMLAPDGTSRALIPKTYAEAYLSGERLVRSHFVEFEGPAPPEGYLPDSVFDFLPMIRERLGSQEERHLLRKAQKEREAEEAGISPEGDA